MQVSASPRATEERFIREELLPTPSAFSIDAKSLDDLPTGINEESGDKFNAESGYSEMPVPTSNEPHNRKSMDPDTESTIKSALVDDEKSNAIGSTKEKRNKRKRKKKHTVNNNKFSVYLVNIRGATSK